MFLVDTSSQSDLGSLKHRRSNEAFPRVATFLEFRRAECSARKIRCRDRHRSRVLFQSSTLAKNSRSNAHCSSIDIPDTQTSCTVGASLDTQLLRFRTSVGLHRLSFSGLKPAILARLRRS